MKLKDLKIGGWFTIHDIPEPLEHQVWVRGSYDRKTKKFICYKWSDINDFRLWDGNMNVFTDFIF